MLLISVYLEQKFQTTAVDPPYEIDVTENGIKFESIVLGTTWLRFKSC